MDVPILILSYNKPSLAESCLRSARAAGYAESGLYLVDNGSSPPLDPTVWGFDGVSLIRLSRNRGYSGGMQEGIGRLFGLGHRSVLVLTNDTRIEAGVAEACLSCATRHGAGLVAPAVARLGDPERLESLGGWFDRRSCSLEHLREAAPESLLPDDTYVPGSAFWVSREAWEATGGFDTGFHTYWEDVDLSFRARAAAIPLARCPGARVLHAGGRTCRKKPRYSTFYFWRNRIKFCRRHLTEEEWSAAQVVLCHELVELEAEWCRVNDRTRLGYLDTLRRELA